MAATSDPKCSGPVGEGAKRPRYRARADRAPRRRQPPAISGTIQRAEALYGGTHRRNRRVLLVAMCSSHHGRRIFGAAEAAVVAAERAIDVAFFDVEVVAQDRASVAQVRAQLEQVLVRRADQPHPERHHLHEAARVGHRDRVLAEIALVMDHAEHELRDRVRRASLRSERLRGTRFARPRRESAPRACATCRRATGRTPARSA